MKHSVEAKARIETGTQLSDDHARYEATQRHSTSPLSLRLSILNRALHRTMETVHLLTGFYKNRRPVETSQSLGRQHICRMFRQYLFITNFLSRFQIL